MFSRYFTYFIQFLTSILIAVKLGPYYFGVWGFILLIINYMRIIDFGIANALNVFMVQNKLDDKRVSVYSTNSLVLVAILGFLLVLFGLYYFIVGIPFFDKYEVKGYFFYLCIIGIMANFNVLLMNIYRVKNNLFFLSFYQSIIPILIFLSLFVFRGKELVNVLIGCYLLGNITSLFLFIIGNKIPKLSKISFKVMSEILIKGFYLFIYNLSFYLIVLSLKTLVSIYYSVEEFGIFSFSFTLSNSILLFLQALTFVIFPKVIDKLKGNNLEGIYNTINMIRDNYVTMGYLLVFCALAIYPTFLSFLPKYKDAFESLSLTSLTVVLYTNSFGFGTLLIAQNREKLNALISFMALVVNLVVALLLILVFKVDYNLVIVSTILAYILYSLLCVFFGKNILKIKRSFLDDLHHCFPLVLFIPFLIAVLLIVFDLQSYMFLPLLLFIGLNFRKLLGVLQKIKYIINKPDIINLNK
ncbi:oligosaccharide flippase family protein [Myroides sp. LJL110]